MSKLKKTLKYSQTQEFKLWHNLHAKIYKTQNSTQVVTKLKTQIVTTLKNLNFGKIQRLKL